MTSIDVDISVDARPLKMLRQRIDLSGRELARRMGVDPSVVCRWSSGQRMPSYRQVMQLCRILGVANWQIVTVHEAAEPSRTSVRAPGATQTPAKAPSGTRGHPTSAPAAGPAASTSTPA